jgi:hypothetical protein
MGRKLKLHLGIDDSPECPTNWDGQWRLISFSNRHFNYQHPQHIEAADLRFSILEDGTIDHVAIRRKLEVGTAFVLSHYEHGDSLWMLKDGEKPAGVEFQWDGVRVAGLLIWEHSVADMGAKTYGDRMKDAQAFLDTYNAWANGEVHGYMLDTLDGEHVDSCWGFYDVDCMIAENIKPNLESGDVIVEVDGDASWIADHHDIPQFDPELATV